METPLKGGLNTPLHNINFAAPNTARQVAATPNTLLSAVGATPKTIVDGRECYFMVKLRIFGLSGNVWLFKFLGCNFLARGIR